jgi:flagellar basal-body rod protein FlgF
MTPTDRRSSPSVFAMERGLYIAASGMLAELVRQDQLANDLANASTPGYKADRAAQASFGELLLENSASGQSIGPLGLGVHIAEMKTDLSQGPVKQTGEPLDVALGGPGFLSVQTPQGARYTRNGQLTVDAKGQLALATGATVLDAQGNPISVGTHSADLAIGPDGTVSAAGKTLGRLAIVSLATPLKVGDNLFTGTPGAAPAGTTVQQGALEGSSTNPARVMVDMIVSLRAYESSQRVIHAIDETLQRGINSAGSVGGS